jgi:hypothetical protein
MKVGRGHVCNIKPSLLGADQTLVDISPCRYRVPFIARRGSIRLFGDYIPFSSSLCAPSNGTDTFACSQAALGRVSALLQAQKEPKPTPPKKLRGKKATAA